MDSPHYTMHATMATSRSSSSSCSAVPHTQEDVENEEGKPKFPEESNALLRKWHALTQPGGTQFSASAGATSTRWTTQNHSQFPADFRRKVAAVALAWQLPLVPFNRKPGDLVQQVAAETHAQMGLQ